VSQRIGMLEALLARIKSNAAKPRITHAEPELEATTVEVEQVHEPLTPEREVEVPLESRARLVAAPSTHVEPEDIEADEVLELDDRHVVQEEISVEMDAATKEISVAEIKPQEPAPVEEPPPSSRRPIAEPAETPQEAQIHIAHTHTPPPESGKQVAAEALSFDDDFTGVREAAAPRPVASPEPSIQLQSLRMPAVQPAARDEMEVELPETNEATRPPPGPLPEMRSPRIESAEEHAPARVTAEVTRPTRPVAAAQVAEMVGTVKPASPKTFGELLDLALSL
jgi:hypothetical protein